MAIANLLVQVRTAGANQLRNLSSGFRQAGRAGSQAAAELRRDFDRASIALRRAREEEARLRREFNRAPSQEAARALHMAALAARQASHEVDNLADQFRQANRQARSLAGRMGAIAAAGAALGTLGSDLPGRTKFLAAAVTALVSLAPALGAALQGALLVALGGAGLGVAIASALKDVDIRRAVTEPLNEIGADLKNFGRQLGPALIQSATAFRRAWRGAADYVRSLFGDLGTTIGPLTQGLIGMLREMGPGLKQAFAVAVPVLNEFASMLPLLGRAMSDFFDSISESKAGALKGIRFLVLALAGSIMLLGDTIEFLSKWFDFWTKAAEKVYGALGKIPLLGRPFKELAEILHAINEPVGDLNKDLRVMGGTQLAMAQATRSAAQAMQELSTKMDALFGRITNSRDAARQYEAAIDALTESVKENGHSLDIHTEKGRANEEAIDNIAKAAYNARQAAIDMAGGQDASASAVQAANAKYQQQINDLATLMRQLGFTQAQIDAVLASWRNLANAPNTTKYIDVVVRTRGDVNALRASGNVAPGGPNIGYAAGTPNAPRGWAWVGEKGPELVNFGGGETVLSARDSARQARGGRSGGGGVTLVYNGGGGGDSLVYRWLNESIRTGRLRVA